MIPSTPPSNVDLDALLQKQRRQWEDGTPVRVESILEQYAALANHKDAVLDLINHEIVLRTEFESPPTCDEYVQRFPDLKADLLLLFEVHQAIEGDEEATMLPPEVDPYATSKDPYKAKSSEAPIQVPQVTGYETLDKLGQGGMGVVYKARQIALNRFVALKMIRGTHANADDLARFRREAEAVAHLQHPNIVQIFETGELEGQPFFSLEYLDGGSLSDHLEGTGLPPLAVARLVETLARAVHYAHSHGIIHRDLKPGNILLQKASESSSQSGEGPCWLHKGIAYVPKIADFGLAKRVEQNSDATQTQAIIGTPSYMAPEQAGDFKRRIGPAADVYSLGAILYELLTGRPPFRGETVLDTLDQVRTQEPILPTRLQPRLPRDLETICLKCLRKDPAQRYGSAEALADDLGRFLRHEPIRARPTTAWQALHLWCRRHPAVAALSASLIGLAFVSLGVVTYLWLEARAGREFAEAQLYDERIQSAQRFWQESRPVQMRLLLESLRPRPGEPDRRDFEWYYLWRLLHQELATIPAGLCLAYSRDGSLLATGVGEEIHIWKTADLEKPDPQPLMKLQGHTASVKHLAFNLKGNRLLSASLDKHDVRLWDLGTQKTIHIYPPHPAGITGIAFNPVDGGTATACQDGVIRLFEPDGTKRLELDEHFGQVNDLVFSTDGKRLVSAGNDKTIIVWNVATGEIVHKLRGQTRPVLSVALHGRRIASGSEAGIVRLWDIEKGKLLHEFTPLPHKVQRLAFRSDGKQLAAGLEDQTIAIWQMDQKRIPHDPTTLLRGHGQSVVGLSFSPLGDRLASVTRGSRLSIWNPNQNQECLVSDLPTLGDGLALCPTNPSLVAIAARDMNISLYDWRTGQRKILKGHTGLIDGLSFADDGTLASVGRDGKIRIWDVEQASQLREFATTGTLITSLAYHPGAYPLVTGDEKGVLRFWEPGGGRELSIAELHAKDVNALAFSPNGRWLASAGMDGMVLVSESDSGRVRLRLSDPDRTPLALAFSADSKFLAAGDRESTIRIWNLRTGKRVFQLEGHDSKVQGVAFTHSGRRLASASADGTIKLWGLTTGLELLTLRGHGRDVSAVIFAPHDEALISLGRAPLLQGQLRVWKAGKQSRITPP